MSSAQAKKIFEGAVKVLQDMTNSHVAEVDAMGSKHMQWMQTSLQEVWMAVTGESTANGAGAGQAVPPASSTTVPAAETPSLVPMWTPIGTPTKAAREPEASVAAAGAVVADPAPAPTTVTVPPSAQPQDDACEQEDLGAKRARGVRGAKPPLPKKQGASGRVCGSVRCRAARRSAMHSSW
jgi:hypothetical protein